jgi:hypothetical protein
MVKKWSGEILRRDHLLLSQPQTAGLVKDGVENIDHPSQGVKEDTDFIQKRLFH